MFLTSALSRVYGFALLFLRLKENNKDFLGHEVCSSVWYFVKERRGWVGFEFLAGLEGLDLVRRGGSANCVRKMLFPPVKSCSVVRIRPEFSVSNFAGNCSFFQMDGSLLLAFKGRFFFSSTARKSFFSLNCPKGDSLLKCRKTI